jgi:hypothetical protein
MRSLVKRVAPDISTRLGGGENPVYSLDQGHALRDVDLRQCEIAKVVLSARGRVADSTESLYYMLISALHYTPAYNVKWGNPAMPRSKMHFHTHLQLPQHG